MRSINGINWKIRNIPQRLIEKNKQDLNISYILSNIFIDKKYTNEEIYNSIYQNKNANLTYENQDFVKAGFFVKKCLKLKKKILIFGDYDVDGYSSTYLLYDYFTMLNIGCDYYIPDRFLDGYGPNKILLKKLLKKDNYGLVIFVDCGTNSIEEISYLENTGVNTIIIDHHQIYQFKSFDKTVIINPKKNLSNTKYSFLCATALVYFFIKYLVSIFEIKVKIDFDKYLFFSAIATICDQMPMRGFNKIIVNNGIKNLNFKTFKNLNQIINLKGKITSTDIAFFLGPVLNSAGRLGYSDLPIKLLTEKKITNIDRISQKLIKLNDKRKIIQSRTIKLLKDNFSVIENEVVFKYKENINEGLLGIIAANFVEIYNKPCFVLTNSGNFIKCSSRSIHGFDIGNFFYLAKQKKIIINGGGHSMAGGCTLKKNKLVEFKKFLNLNYIKKFKNFDNHKHYISEQNYESLLLFAKKDFQNLEPFGNNNISPYFLIRNNRIIKFKIIKHSHLQLLIKNRFNKSCLCFVFNALGTKLGDILINSKKNIDLIVQINNKIIKKNSDFNLIIKDAIV